MLNSKMMQRRLQYLQWMTELGTVLRYNHEDGVLVGEIKWSSSKFEQIVYSVHPRMENGLLMNYYRLPDSKQELYLCLLEIRAMVDCINGVQVFAQTLMEAGHEAYHEFTSNWVKRANLALRKLLGPDYIVEMDASGVPKCKEVRKELLKDFTRHLAVEVLHNKYVCLKPEVPTFRTGIPYPITPGNSG